MLGGAVRLICALALVVVAFAHKPVPFVDPASLDLSAYILPDGTTPSLCLGEEDGSGKKHSHSGACEFCRIANSALLSDIPQLCEPLGYRMRTGADTFQRIDVDRSAFWPAAPPQGPPTPTA